jgi:Ca2+-binding RTX toxin-like protein
MLVAGSVLALLLAGLTVDGLLHPTVDEEGTDTDGDTPDNDDQSGGITSLNDLLFPDDDTGQEDKSLHGRAEALGYTRLDDVEDFPEEVEASASAEGLDEAAEPRYDMPAETSDFADQGSSLAATFGVDASATVGMGLSANAGLDIDAFGSDSSGVDAFGANFEAGLETPGDGQNLLDVTETTTLPDGSEVPLVTDFDSGTDILVMEFDGTANDAPEITVGSDINGEHRVVEANGQPITVVQDAPDFTEKHISVVMSSVDDGLPGMDAEGLQDVLDDFEADQADGVDATSDIVANVTDGIPDTEVLDDLFDTIGEDLSDLSSSSDMLDARAGLDPAFGTGGGDAMTGSFNSDVITGGDDQDALFGDEGDDTLSGGGGNDEIHGDFGDDNLDGGDGIDFLDGGEGNDTLNGGEGGDVIFGGEGDDLIEGGNGNDILLGGNGTDVLDGGSGNDVLNGTFGNHAGTDQDAGDLLLGGDGDDSILLGNADVATGGTGEDLFTGGSHIDETAGNITDFNPTEDRIEVIYDPETNPDPMIEVRDFENGTGADIILDGQVILSVSGAQGLNPNLIELRASA